MPVVRSPIHWRGWLPATGKVSMMRDTAEQNRRLSGETESGPTQEHARVEVPQESTDAIRFDRSARRGSVRLTRRGVLESMAGVVGGLVLGGLGHERAAEADIPSYPVPDDPTKVSGGPLPPMASALSSKRQNAFFTRPLSNTVAAVPHHSMMRAGSLLRPPCTSKYTMAACRPSTRLNTRCSSTVWSSGRSRSRSTI
jgi:hypothetical protein